MRTISSAYQDMYKFTWQRFRIDDSCLALSLQQILVEEARWCPHFFLTKSASFRTSNVFSDSAVTAATRFKGKRRHGKKGENKKRRRRERPLRGSCVNWGDHVLVLVVGRRKGKGERDACEWGQKRRGKAREKPKPTDVFASPLISNSGTLPWIPTMLIAVWPHSLN